MSDRCLLGTRKGLFVLDRTANGWEIAARHFMGVQVPMVLSVGGETLYAALEHGHFGAKMHRSIDGGANWEEIGVPTFPPKPDDAPEVVDPMRQQPIPWTVKLLWSLERGSDGRLWCGTIPGALFTSSDGGDTWELNEALWNMPDRANWFGGGYDYPGIHSIAIHPSDPQNVSLGISCGGVWHTDDGGNTWGCRAEGMRAAYMPPDRAYDPSIQDPHRLVRCASQPDHYWVQHHNGIFRSVNGCRNWSEHAGAQPSTFGFAACVHPEKPDQAWFVPASSDEQRYPVDGKVVVTRTRDGGESFETLYQGLPQVHAYDIVFRHCLDVSADGRSLIMGSTTGNVWSSDDEGDSWQTVTQHLPPVYCVRFA